MTAPPVPPDVDLRDFPFTPIYRTRLFASAFHATATDAEWRAGMTLWLKSWDQSPAGSLPYNEVELCRLAELGRDMKTWRKVRDVALLHWEPADDGRLYHSFISEIVTEAWNRKRAQRNRTKAATDARRNVERNDQRNGDRDDNVTVNVTSTKRIEEKEKGQLSSNLRFEAPSSPLRYEEGSREAAFSIIEKGLALLGKRKRRLIGKMLNKHGNPQVEDALNAVERENPDDPAAFFVACCQANNPSEKPQPQHNPGPQGPPPSPAELWPERFAS